MSSGKEKQSIEDTSSVKATANALWFLVDTLSLYFKPTRNSLCHQQWPLFCWWIRKWAGLKVHLNFTDSFIWPIFQCRRSPGYLIGLDGCRKTGSSLSFNREWWSSLRLILIKKHRTELISCHTFYVYLSGCFSQKPKPKAKLSPFFQKCYTS